MTENVKINQSKVRKLVQDYPKGLVLLSSWLVANGYSYELQQRYRKNGWLRLIGKGAMLKLDDPFLLSGALSTLQTQANINIHYGGRSALELQGKSHYLRLASPIATLFAPGQTRIPAWFINNKWDVDYELFKTSLFHNDNVGLVDYQEALITMKISKPGRAMMECISLCPDKFSLMEAYELMEGLTSLQPKHQQELLEECKSIKAKRLFLYFAERAGHNWFKYIDQTKIDLGSGSRSLTTNGALIAKYNLILPK